ncbi:hypothetical protein ACFQZ4_47650 [Catellatospora coxensis]
MAGKRMPRTAVTSWARATATAGTSNCSAAAVSSTTCPPSRPWS